MWSEIKALFPTFLKRAWKFKSLDPDMQSNITMSAQLVAGLNLETLSLTLTLDKGLADLGFPICKIELTRLRVAKKIK